MKRKNRIALLLLVFALLCTVCAVFASAADSKTIDSGLYDGTKEITVGGWPYNTATNATIVTEGDNSYYRIADGQNSMRLPFKEFGTNPRLTGGDYSYFTFQMDFRASNNTNDQWGNFLLTTGSVTIKIIYQQIDEDGNARLVLEDNGPAIKFENITEWHTLELVMKRLSSPIRSGRTTAPNSVYSSTEKKPLPFAKAEMSSRARAILI